MKKKLIRLTASLVTVLSLSLVPAAVHAQDVIDVEGDSTDTTETTDTLPTTGAPDAGVAPSDNQLGQNAAVFVGGSVLGAAIGVAFLAARKKQAQS